MTNYTVRVELHDADSEDYENLHEEMRKQGFYKQINVDSGSYELPTAEYSKVSDDLSSTDILKKAQTAANKVKPKPEPSILVTGSTSVRVFSGLKKIK
ncbi:hypothetical protein FS593_05390 [Lelliottia amnigena]|uniref:hypothetical protein n=1 Tax=Lelliottia amnigena TaxID=61646 RepID=UPI001F16EA2E|nr:hypothetical protein [Lelliottia amnigena]UJD93765.1 hypothetical protein FS593_05390 [Lelliottia amnigena]